MRRQLKLTILLPLINVLLSIVLLYAFAPTPVGRFDSVPPPLPLAIHLCFAINAPALLLWLPVRLVSDSTGLEMHGRWTLLLLCIALFWFLVGLTLNHSKLTVNGRRTWLRHGLTIATYVVSAVFLLIMSIAPVEYLLLPLKRNAFAALVGNQEWLGYIVQGGFDVLWAGLFIVAAVLKAKRIFRGEASSVETPSG
jgi:hypothetical protein